MIIQPRSTTPRTPRPPAADKPAIFDGFSPRQTVAASTAYTAAIGGLVGFAVTRDPSNLFKNVLGGAVAGTILGPAAAASNLHQRGFSDAAVEQAGNGGLYGALAGAGAGCIASLALSLAVPESGLLNAATLLLATGGAVAGATLATTGS